MEVSMGDLIFKARVFEFLNELRSGGSVNMFGASSNIMEEFSITNKEAKLLLLEWMENYRG